MDLSEAIRFSIITPTFNRSQLLPRLAQSLISQHEHISEWILIDDGSTDNTFDVVNEIRQSAPFPIKYIFHQNRGMLHSMNIGMSNVSATYFFKLDSDDFLLPGALNHIYETISSVLSKKSIPSISGFSFSAQSSKGFILNNISSLKDYCITISPTLFLGKYSAVRISGKYKYDLLDVYPSRPILDHFRYPRFGNDQRFSGLIAYFMEDYFQSQVVFSTTPVFVKHYMQAGISKQNLPFFNLHPKSYLLGSLWELSITRDNPSVWFLALRRFVKSFIIIFIDEVSQFFLSLIKRIRGGSSLKDISD